MMKLKTKTKTKTKIEIGIGIVFLCSVIILTATYFYDRSYKTFVENVDNFCRNWNRLIEELDDTSPDTLMVDSYGLLLQVEIETMSEIYDQYNNREKLNQYLADNINQYMFHQAVYYIEHQVDDSLKCSNELSRFYENPTPFGGLEVSDINLYQGTDGYIHCKCKVTNKGNFAYRFMQAKTYFRDKEGNIIGYNGYGLVGSNELEAGDTNELDFNFYEEGVYSCDMVIDYQ